MGLLEGILFFIQSYVYSLVGFLNKLDVEAQQ